MKFFSLTNQFLIAMPKLDGDTFERSLVYVCEHNEKGAMALIINRPLDVTFNEIIEELSITSTQKKFSSQINVGYGGPVNRHYGCVLHRASSQWQQTVSSPITNIALTTSTDILSAIAENEGPDEALVTLGFAGWEPGQLEKELRQNYWLNCSANSDLLFDVKPSDRWLEALKSLGVEPHRLVLHTGIAD